MTADARAGTPRRACTSTTTASGSTRTTPSAGSSRNDGGIAITYDKGGNFLQPQNLPIGQFYEVSYDYAVPYNICGGAQDNGAWCGPSRRRNGNINNSYWFTISGGDGFYTAQDPTDPNIVYGESQGGNASRVNLKTGERMRFAKPGWQEQYKLWEDSIAILRGDPLKPAAPAVTAAIAALKAKQKQDSIDLSLRFNWNSPFFISPHNPAVIYFGGNRVLKSVERGENFYAHLTRPLQEVVGEDRHVGDVDGRHHDRCDGRGDVRHGGRARRELHQAGPAVCRHRRRQRAGCRRTTARRGRTSPRSSRASRPTIRSWRASSHRTSTRSRSTWRSTTIVATTSRRTCS